MKSVPHILMRKSHITSISTILNLLHNIVNKKSMKHKKYLCNLYALHRSYYAPTANRHLYTVVKKTQEGTKVAP